MAATWDRREAAELAKAQDGAVAVQVRDAIAPFSPFWRAQFAALGRSPASLRAAVDLESLPAVGERDVCPTGDPAGMAGLVLQESEAGYTIHASGPRVRRALLRRLVSTDDYRQIVDEDARPTSYVFGGLGLRYPIASTRGDLDLVARAGARLWQVLGLTDTDALVSAVPTAASAEHRALELAALGSGSPALFCGPDPAAIAATLRLVPATVLAAPAEAAADLVDELVAAGTALSSIHTLLLIGAPSTAERQAAEAALAASDAPTGTTVLAAHAPSGARVLWGECRESRGMAGLHTYPDLDVVQLADPDTGGAYPGTGPGELVLTQLGFRGTALLRWRTGDIVTGPLLTGPCPSCGRTVPRVPGETLHRAALVRPTRPPLDLRAVAGAVAGHPGVAQWFLAVGRRARDRAETVVIHLAVDGDPAQVAVGAAAAVRAAAGGLPAQIVASPDAEFRPPAGRPLTPHITLTG